MSFGEAALALLKDRLLPEVGEIKQVLSALVTRLDTMERESIRRFELIDMRFELIDKRFEQIDKRFEQIDKRFEQIEKRIEDQGLEHSRRLDLLDKRMERLEVRVEALGDRTAHLTEAIARLSLLGDYVRRIDEMAAELRELRRRQDELERRHAEEVLPRLPKVGT